MISFKQWNPLIQTLMFSDDYNDVSCQRADNTYEYANLEGLLGDISYKYGNPLKHKELIF